jgi:NAD(P)-dependent dehydrogenase (short-subunit alcohol dehydrogenase family)
MDIKSSQPCMQGRVAVVTGASSGIGAAAARHLAALGAHVILVGRDTERLRGALEGTRTAGADGRHVAIAADLTDAADIEEIARAVQEGPARVDVLVHSAGIYEPTPFGAITATDLDRVWGINLRAPFLLTQALVPMMPGGASIVFVSSASGRIGVADETAYCASKSGLDGLMRALAVELAPAIRVNTVAPGFTKTPMNEELRRDSSAVVRAEQAILANRLGNTDDVAQAITYLASDAASFVYGAILPVDGGYPISHIQGSVAAE